MPNEANHEGRRTKDLLRQALERTPDCPSAEEWEKYRAGEVAGERRSVLASHLGECPACFAEIELLTRFESPEVSAAEAEPVEWIVARLRQQRSAAAARESRSRRRFALPGWLRPASLAFASVLVVISAALWWKRTPPVLDPSRTGVETLRSGAVELLSPLGSVTEAPAEMRWMAAPGALRYEVRLMRVDRETIWSAETPDTVVVLPETARQSLPAGVALLWEVRALGPSGIIGASGVREFRIQPPGQR